MESQDICLYVSPGQDTGTSKPAPNRTLSSRDYSKEELVHTWEPGHGFYKSAQDWRYPALHIPGPDRRACCSVRVKGTSQIAHKRGPKNGLKRQEEAASYQGLILHPSPPQLITFLQARGLLKA